MNRTEWPGATMDRRSWLAAATWMTGGAAVKGIVDAATAAAPSPPPHRTIRIAHLTDIHLQPEGSAIGSTVECLHQLQRSLDPPELILVGGDAVMDAFGQSADRTRWLWTLWNRVLRYECSIRVEPCIGNHDIWGWNRSGSNATGNEPLYGKAWAMEGLGIGSPYRRFDQVGWRFLVLDSTQSSDGPSGYVARLDEEQFEWFAAELAATPREMPVLVLSHIPILSAAAYFDGENEGAAGWQVPAALMHTDARRIVALFRRHPNVRLCLSGHLHLVDRVVYENVTYLCNGAVCGAWWGRSYRHCPPGYAIIDLCSDGSFHAEYIACEN